MKTKRMARMVKLARNIPVLYYHDISPAGPHTPEWFEEQLDVVEELGFTTISAHRCLDICRGARPLDGKYIVITFDDGHVSNWLYAAPALMRRNMVGSFFALCDFTDEGLARDPQNPQTCLTLAESLRQAFASGDHSQFMNRSELSALVHDMGMEVYSHTARHQPCFRGLVPRPMDAKRYWGCPAVYGEDRPDLPQFQWDSGYAYNGFWPVWNDKGELDFVRRSDEERYAFCLEDFKRSFDYMRELNGREEQLFCWPWGHFDELSAKAMKKAGYKGAFTTERRPTAPGTDPWRMGRLGVGSERGGKWLRSRLKLYSTTLGTRVFFKHYRKKLDVSHVLMASHSDDGSGGGRQLINSALGLVERGVGVTVATPEGSVIARALAGTGVDIVARNDFSGLLSTARFLLSTARRRKADVVHTFHSKSVKPGLLAALADRLLGRSFRLFLNRGVLFAPNPLYFLFARIASGVVCNSMACADVLNRRGVPRSRLLVAPNALEASGEIYEQAVERRMAEPEGPFRVLYVGNGKPAKGFDVFVKSVAAYLGDADAREAEFTALGVTAPEKAIHFSSREVLWHVRCPGKVTHGQVLEEMARAHVLVLSSRQESMPNVVLEAMGMGLPVVCTRAGGVPELVEHGQTGFLCEVESVQCLADHLVRLAHERALGHQLGAAGQKLVRTRHSLKAKALSLLQIYSGMRGTDKPVVL